MIKCILDSKLDKVANSAGVTVKKDQNGDFRAYVKQSRTFVGSWKTEEEAISEIGKLTPQSLKDLGGSLPFPTRSGVPTTITDIRPNDSLDMTPLRTFISLAEVGPLSFFTPAKQLMESVERLGWGKMRTLAYNPTQKGKHLADYALGQNKHKGLGNKTYQEAMHDLGKATVNLPTNQVAHVTHYYEAFTKEELLKPGVLTKNGLSQEELNVAAGFKLARIDPHEIPVLLRVNALIDSFLKNRDFTLNKLIPDMRIAIEEGKLPPEMAEDILRMARMAGDEDNLSAVLTSMGYTPDQVTGLTTIRALAEDDSINLMAVYRYATAPDLKPGFKNGRAQYAAEHGMSDEAVKVAEERIKLLRYAFSQHGYSADQVMGAQLPIFRQMIDAGISLPGQQWAETADASVKKYASVLGKLVEGNEVFSRRVLSGHINPHELNPVASTAKHIRNLELRKYLDPEIKKAAEYISSLPESMKKVKDIAFNYLHDLEGRPNEGFLKLNHAFRIMGRMAGQYVGDDLAERFVHTLNWLTSSASIPFRPALIARNMFQTTLNIPIVGGEAWKHGVETALGRSVSERGTPSWSRKAMNEAWERARQAGALGTNIVPIHGGQQAMETTLLSETMLAKAGFIVKDATDVAFSVYRTPDDIGRVISFEAGRFRVNKYLSKYQAERVTDADKALSNLMDDAKVRTFSEHTQAEFATLVKAGQTDMAADLIGKELADKVHFLYGNSNHPNGWGGVAGRLFGQFGTFPVQYLHHIGQGLTLGTKKDKLEFFAMHSAVNIGVVTAGAEIFGADLTNWAFVPSLQYTGGPYAELGINLIQSISGSDAEQSLARRNISMMLPGWDHRSIFIPGSYFFFDVVESLEENTIWKQLGAGAGFRFLDPGQRTLVQKGFGWALDQ